MKRPDELTREYLRRLEEQLLNNKDVFRLMNTIYLNEILDEKKDKRVAQAESEFGRKRTDSMFWMRQRRRNGISGPK